MHAIHSRLAQHFLDAFSGAEHEHFSHVQSQPIQQPTAVIENRELAMEMGFEQSLFDNPANLALLSGNTIPNNIQPIALVYAGHQFGVWAGQLGDGRAMTLGEIEVAGELWDLQLKGAGTTPYSRFGDGRAVLRSSIREYLCSEAMHALGIDTTRALCLINSSTPVYRESVESAAVVCRVARSHIRFGSFEHHHYRGQTGALKALADYLLERHFPTTKRDGEGYRELFENAVVKTAQTIAKWQAIGFSHGVMNTDNMSILGDTIDYGPFGFMDSYDPNFICNHSDNRGRYAFKNQPSIGLWNLNALATALSSLMPSEHLITALERYESEYQAGFLRAMTSKLGLAQIEPGDRMMIDNLLAILASNRVDYCNFFRALCHYRPDRDNRVISDLFIQRSDFDHWSGDYNERLRNETLDEELRERNMRAVNPKYILRNYMAQEAIDAAQQGNYDLTRHLLMILQTPFDEHPEFERYAASPPDWAAALSVSCSS